MLSLIKNFFKSKTIGAGSFIGASLFKSTYTILFSVLLFTGFIIPLTQSPFADLINIAFCDFNDERGTPPKGFASNSLF